MHRTEDEVITVSRRFVGNRLGRSGRIEGQFRQKRGTITESARHQLQLLQILQALDGVVELLLGQGLVKLGRPVDLCRHVAARGPGQILHQPSDARPEIIGGGGRPALPPRPVIFAGFLQRIEQGQGLLRPDGRSGSRRRY